MRTEPPPVVCEWWAASAARFAARCRRTSTRWVSSSRGRYATGEAVAPASAVRTPGTQRITAATRCSRPGRPSPRARRRARQLGRQDPDPVHLHVVGMAVATVRVVDRQHVGPLLAQDVGQARRPARRGRGRRTTLRARVGVRRARTPSPGSPGSPSGRSPAPRQIGRAPRGGVLRDWRGLAYHRLTDRLHPRSRSRAPHGARRQRPGQRATGQQRLVVGVRVKGDEGERHPRSFPRTGRDAGVARGGRRAERLVRMLLSARASPSRCSGGRCRASSAPRSRTSSRALELVTAPDAVVLVVLWALGLFVYSFVLTGSLAGLSRRRAMTLNLTGSAVTNVLPVRRGRGHVAELPDDPLVGLRHPGVLGVHARHEPVGDPAQAGAARRWRSRHCSRPAAA